MSPTSKIILSNRVEELYRQLTLNLFKESDPFAKRMIIVPSPAMKTWLTLRMAVDLDICMGVEFYYLEEGFHFLQKEFISEKEKNYIPTHLELAVKIEVELKKKLLEKEENKKGDSSWNPLLKYLTSDGLETKKMTRRIIALSDKLSSLFKVYGRYGRGMVEEWEKESSKEWQAILWKEIYKEWSHPYKAYRSDDIQTKNQKFHIHLFAISYLSPLQMEFLSKINQHTHLIHYFLSPCSLFWSDLCSDKQKIYLQRYWNQKNVSECQKENLEELLRNRNRLLGNFGRLGREIAKEIEKYPALEEKYVITKGIAGSDFYENYLLEEYEIDHSNTNISLLQALQADMLMLRNPEEEELVFLEKDNSIQVHVATNKLREVEVVYNTIMRLIDLHLSEEEGVLYPSDILVLTPDIMAYESYIKAVFDRKDSQLKCQIMDLKIPIQNPLIQAFLHLLSLFESRWDSKNVLYLLEYADFREKHSISFIEAQEIKEWVRKIGITWGENSEERDEILLSEHCLKGMVEKKESGTWEEGIKNLFLSLAMVDKDREIKNHLGEEFPSIDFSESITLSKFIKIFKALKEDEKKIKCRKGFTLDEWGIFLNSLLESYFECHKENENQYYLLKEKISKLITLKNWFKEEKFLFLSIKKRLESLLEEEEVSYRENHLQTIKFCSLLPMRAIPSKVIVLMGMNGEAFPRQEYQLSLNLMKGRKDVDFYPNQIDYDRYLFLEILLSARNYLIITHATHASESDLAQGPSILVDELLNYCDSGYRIEDKLPSESCLYKHPNYSFDSIYFLKDSNIKNYFVSHYREALSYYHIKKTNAYSFIEDFPCELVPISENIVDIKDLKGSIRNPLKLYFNKALGIYFKKEKLLETEEKFTLSPLDIALIKKISIKTPKDKIFEIATKNSKFPLGCFGQIAKIKLESENEKVIKNLDEIGISICDIFSIFLSEECNKPYFDIENNLIVPAVELTIDSKTIKIIGKISDVCKKGIVAYAEDKFEDVIKYWVDYVLIAFIIEKYQVEIEQSLLLIKNRYVAKSGIPCSPEKLLKDIIKLYYISEKNPSPLIPEWVIEILNGSKENFEKKLENTLNNPFMPIYNDYLQWMFNNSESIDVEKIILNWKEITTEIYGKPINHWFNHLINVEENANE